MFVLQMTQIFHILVSSPIPLFLMISLPAFAEAGDDTFSSTSEMAALASKEARLVTSLREYRERLEERLSEVKKSVEEIKKKLDEEDYELRVEEVKRKLEEGDLNLRISRRALEKETVELPSQGQMEGAAQGIFLLQVIHLHNLTSPSCYRKPTILTYQLLPVAPSASLCFPTLGRHPVKFWPQGTPTFLARSPTTADSTTGLSSGFSRLSLWPQRRVWQPTLQRFSATS